MRRARAAADARAAARRTPRAAAVRAAVTPVAATPEPRSSRARRVQPIRRGPALPVPTRPEAPGSPAADERADPAAAPGSRPAQDAPEGDRRQTLPDPEPGRSLRPATAPRRRPAPSAPPAPSARCHAARIRLRRSGPTAPAGSGPGVPASTAGAIPTDPRPWRAAIGTRSTGAAVPARRMGRLAPVIRRRAIPLGHPGQSVAPARSAPVGIGAWSASRSRSWRLASGLA